LLETKNIRKFGTKMRGLKDIHNHKFIPFLRAANKKTINNFQCHKKEEKTVQTYFL
jgi:hypothetical protein